MFRKHPPMKDRRNIGEVVFPMEKMLEARELSSCCIGVEAALETNTGFEDLVRRLGEKPDSK